MTVPLEQKIQRQGWNQADVVKLLENMRDLANDMKDAINELVVDASAQRANIASFMVSAIAASLTTATYTPPALTAATVTISDLTLNAG